jgi:phenylalanyl-tRNA synthetase beta subunit
LKEIKLFDVYEGTNLGEGKSYALSFIIFKTIKNFNRYQIDMGNSKKF